MELEIQDAKRGFKVRAAAIVVRDGRLLLHSMPGRDYWMAPGGGVRFGETSRRAVAREIREELGVEPKVGRLLWVVEHFFQSTVRKRHQVAWFHEVALPDDCGAVRRETWQIDEADGRVTFRWVPLKDLATLRVVPGFLRDAVVHLPRGTRHLVHRDAPSGG
jgi:ADP-ribose pyrophosphatase YjhB (NUDIX family)